VFLGLIVLGETEGEEETMLGVVDDEEGGGVSITAWAGAACAPGQE
jgi:hypothetical protein